MIKLDAVAVSTDQTATPLTWTHVVGTGTNRMLVVMVALQDAFQPSATAVTYNGISMTKAVGEQGTNSPEVYFDEASVWLLPNPPAGSHTVSVTVSDITGEQDYGGASVSLFGAIQSTTPDATGASTGTTVGSSTASLTTVASGAWMLGVMHFMNNGSTSGSITSAQTIRETLSLVTNIDGRLSAVDTNGPVAPGSNTISFTSTAGTGGTAYLYSIAAVSIAPTIGPSFNPPYGSKTTGMRPHAFSPGIAR